jgi:hypothetical protein
MSFGAPPSKAAQEQEAAARNAAIEAAGGADNQNEGNVEVVGEDTAPAPVTSQHHRPPSPRRTSRRQGKSRQHHQIRVTRLRAGIANAAKPKKPNTTGVMQSPCPRL